MDEHSNLGQQIRTRLAAANDRREAERQRLHEEMGDLERRTARFNEIATRSFDEVLHPRIAELINNFPNAKLLPAEPGHSHQLVCLLDQTDNTPATVKLSLGLGPDARLENLIASYALEILPVFFQFERCDQKTFPLDGLDDKAIAGWFDDKILSFVDTYVQIEHIDQYQQKNAVIDPVCGMRLTKTLAACHVEHKGRTYYFCLDECQKKFVADPARYLAIVPK